ncbi:MAG: rRNA pseudouridine synthase [Gaiellales bacterium]|nr:MAG: rRNA pseudouridine synthase [Gaiellales bacterium]
MPGERLQRYLARAGVAARRKCEELITAGRVTVNGEVVTELGSRVSPGDEVLLDGRPVAPEPLRYLLLNKPAGVVTTVTDPQGRPTVTEMVGGPGRLYPVGRLDIDTTGLLLVTNDGGLAHRLMHPSFGIDKVYVAQVEGMLTRGDVERLTGGVLLEDGMTAPARVRVVGRTPRGSIVELVIHEGRKRQVRRMLAAVGRPVLKLHRRQYAMLTDAGMAPGDFRELGSDEVEALKRLSERGSE